MLLVEGGPDMIMDTVLAKDVITVQAPVRRHMVAATAVVSVERGNAARARTTRTGQWGGTWAKRGAQQWIMTECKSHQHAILRDLWKLAQVPMLEVNMRLLLVGGVRDHANGVGDHLLRSTDRTQNVAKWV